MAKIELEISDQNREDQLVTALEGGSNSWYYLDDTTEIDNYLQEGDEKLPLATAMWRAIKDGKSIPIFDAENPEEKLGEISLASIEKGEQLMADNSPSHFMQMYLENGDAETADVWFQYAVLGKITFG